MSLKASLLKASPHVEEHPILGVTVFIRRLTIAELDEYEHDLQEAQKTGFSSDASKAGAKLILKLPFVIKMDSLFRVKSYLQRMSLFRHTTLRPCYQQCHSCKNLVMAP
ncbi:hypothetical protein G9396_15570 [Providencia rettgeri]|nr:hypothetical protein G9396_15570 [Providencia rettgeri]